MGIPCRAFLVGIVTLAACGQKSSEPGAASGSATGSTVAATPPKPAISAADKPALAAAPDDEPDTPDPTPSTEAPLVTPRPRATTDPVANPGTEFERQTRDPSWAGPMETELRNRVTKLGARIDTAECRHDRCLIALRGSEEEMADVIAKLESPVGLQGYAQSIYLTAPVEQGGTLVVRAYATFDR